MADFYGRETTRHLHKLRQLKPEMAKAFQDFSQAVFKDGALSSKIKNLVAVGVAHVTQCPWCISGHVKRAKELGATDEEIAEVIFVAMEMRAGAAFTHGGIAMAETEEPHGH
jgi:AhpD family alkylhydroperoxidase